MLLQSCCFIINNENSFCSAMTLLPGDIICTGTPFGIGASQVPAQYLKKGDVLETEIDKVGRMINSII